MNILQVGMDVIACEEIADTAGLVALAPFWLHLEPGYLQPAFFRHPFYWALSP